MILAEVSSGRSLLATSSPTKDRQAGIGRGRGVLDRRAAAVTGRGKGRGPHRDDLLGVLRLHGLDRVAGIDRPLEGVGRDHLDDLGDLHDVEQRRDARHHVLEARGRGRDEGVVGRRQRHDQRGQRLGEIVGIGAPSASSTFLTPASLAAASAAALAFSPATSTWTSAPSGCRRGQRLVGGVLDRRIVVFGNQQRGHQRTPASVLSFEISSATSLTLTPPLRPGGSVVLSTSRRGVRSTP